MAHPEWAMKHKTKGTELRCIRGRYYLYRISSKWDKERKVTRKITHEMLGCITKEDGLIPRGERRRKEIKIKVNQTLIYAKEYGASHFLMEIGKDILGTLQTNFPQTGNTLFSLAVNRLLYQAPLKNMQFHYEESFLSHTLTDLNLTKNALTEFMQETGKNREAIVQFMHQFVEGSEHIVFDVTETVSRSKQMNLNHKGYNSRGSFDPQINLLYLFSTDNQSPVYYRTFPGNIQGIKAIKLTIQEANLKDCTAVGDKGFISKENIHLFEDAGLNYILPLKRDSKLLDYGRLSSRTYKDAFDGHFLYQARPIFYYRYHHENKNIIIFHDPRLRLEEESSYLNRLKSKLKGYTLNGFEAKQLSFGTFSVVTNLKKVSAASIYERYKSRQEVETLFDSYKNLLDADRPYMHSDHSFEAWVFINHLAALMYYKVYKLLKKYDKLSSLSPKDLLSKLERVQKLNINRSWLTSEINSKSKELFKTLKIAVT